MNGKRQDISKNTIEIPYRKTLDIEYAKPGFVPKRNRKPLRPARRSHYHLYLTQNLPTSQSLPISPLIFTLMGSFGGNPITDICTNSASHARGARRWLSSETKSITPKPKQPQIHNFTLITTAAAKLQNAPQSYKNTNGIDFRLIKPRNARFEMGGKRSEKGQRANEFLRQIELQRHSMSPRMN